MTEFIFKPPSEENLEVEFGCSFPVNFLDASQVKLYDFEGNQIMCKCGKPATQSVIGKEAFLARCSECGL